MSNMDIFLSQVQKPSRYTGGELNAVLKKPGPDDLRIALFFPDVYEIGMSHLGLKILYRVLNSIDGVFAERVYSPWSDMEAFHRSSGEGLYSLETQTPLGAFDIIGITLQYEVSYTNVLNALQLSGIPMRASDREKGSWPLIMGGGPVVFNAEPVAPFFDLLFVGDAEEEISHFARALLAHKRSGKSLKWQEIFSDFMGRKGYYFPAQFVPSYRDERFSGVTPLISGYEQVTKALVTDLEEAPYDTRPVVPYMETVHNRAVVEISRGCTRGCRFCQAGMIYRPVRDRSPQAIAELARCTLDASGFDELSLLSLSATDYQHISPLLRDLMLEYGRSGVSVSLPSLRAGTLSDALLDELRKVRKSSFTIAPEAGTQRMRDVINKGIDEEDILATARIIFQAGWKRVKLYFMIGLPLETTEDVAGIAHLAVKIQQIAREAAGRSAQVIVSVSQFIPKAHTPFQWWTMDDRETLKAKQRVIEDILRPYSTVQYKFHDARTGLLEAALARGDRRLADVLERAVELGCRLDSWSEHFRFDLWQQAFADCGTSLDRWAYRQYDLNDPLPWDHIDSMISKTWMQEEWQRACQEQVTPDCRFDRCSQCGVCGGEVRLRLNRRQGLDISERETTAEESLAQMAMVPVTTLRIRYKKEGMVRFLSHLETVKSVTSAILRADLPVAYTQGFNQHVKLSFSDALGLGIQSYAEYMDIALVEQIDPTEAMARLNRELPPALAVLDARTGTFAKLSAAHHSTTYQVNLDVENGQHLHAVQWLVRRENKKGVREIDIKPHCAIMGTRPLQFAIRSNPDGVTPKPVEVLEYVSALPREQLSSFVITKMQVVGEGAF